MVNTVAVSPTPFQSGFRLLDGLGVDRELANPKVSTQNGIVAKAGGTITGASAITATFSQVSTSANSGDSVLLPAAKVGAYYVIFNAGANPIQVFATGTDTIDGTAGATGVALANAKRCIYICIDQGIWISAQLGVVSA